MLEKISTMDALWRKGFHLPSICLLCYHEAESTTHLLIHCPFSWEIWCGVSRDFGSTCIVPLDLGSLLLGWRNRALNAFGKRVWRLVPTAVCWAIWLERNNRAFKGHTKLTWKVCRKAKEFIVFWVRRCKGFDGCPWGIFFDIRREG